MGDSSLSLVGLVSSAKALPRSASVSQGSLSEQPRLSETICGPAADQQRAVVHQQRSGVSASPVQFCLLFCDV